MLAFVADMAAYLAGFLFPAGRGSVGAGGSNEASGTPGRPPSVTLRTPTPPGRLIASSSLISFRFAI